MRKCDWVVFGQKISTKTVVAVPQSGRRDIRILEVNEDNKVTHDYGTLMFCDIETLRKFGKFIDAVIKDWESEVSKDAKGKSKPD